MRYQLKQYYTVRETNSKQIQIGNMPPRSIVIDDPPEVLSGLLSYLSRPRTVQEIHQYIKANSDHTDSECNLIIQDLIENGIISSHQVDLNNRYSRHELYFDFIGFPNASNAQLILKEKRVGLIGMGGIGINVAMILTGAGIGSLVILDIDKVEESNLTRQFLYRESTIGSYKVDVAYEQLKALNSSVHIKKVNNSLTEENQQQILYEYFRDCDFVVLSADSPELIHTWVNDAALKYGFSYSNAGYIESFGVIGPLVVPNETACYECYKTPEENNPRPNLNKGYQTPSYGPLNSLVSAIQANEVIRHLLNLDTKTKGCRLLIDSVDYSQSTEEFTPKHDCECTNTCKGGDKYA